MIYKKRFKGEDDWTEITKDEALDTIFGTYSDSDAVRAILEVEGIIPCIYSDILIAKADRWYADRIIDVHKRGMITEDEAVKLFVENCLR